MAKKKMEHCRAGAFPVDFFFEEHKKLAFIQSDDVRTTYADATALERGFDFTPNIKLREGRGFFICSSSKAI